MSKKIIIFIICLALTFLTACNKTESIFNKVEKYSTLKELVIFDTAHGYKVLEFSSVISYEEKNGILTVCEKDNKFYKITRIKLNDDLIYYYQVIGT